MNENERSFSFKKLMRKACVWEMREEGVLFDQFKNNEMLFLLFDELQKMRKQKSERDWHMSVNNQWKVRMAMKI